MEKMKKKMPSRDAGKPFENFREMLSLAALEAGYETAFRFRSGTADRSASYGSVSYAAFFEDVKALGSGLAAAGLLGAHTAVWAKNSYAYITAFLTVLASPGVFLPVDAELSCPDAMDILRAGDARVVFLDCAFYKEHKTKLLRLEGVKRYIVFDLPPEEAQGRAVSYAAFLEAGRAFSKDTGKENPFLTCPLEDEELRMLLFPAGGNVRENPDGVRGVMFSQKNLRSAVLGNVSLLDRQECSLSLLPFHLPEESVSGILLSICQRTAVCICPSPGSVMTDFKLFKPESAALATLFVERLAEATLSTLEAQGKKEILQKLIRTSAALRKAGVDRRRSFFSAVHDAFGGNLRRIVCVGAPVRKETADFFDAVGITLLCGYSLPECLPMTAVFRGGKAEGTLMPGLTVMISREDGEDGKVGEILLQGDSVTMGYYNDPRAARAAFTDAGMLRTGDMGSLGSRGRITIAGRRTNRIRLKNGKTVYPEELEARLLHSPYIAEATVCIAHGQTGEQELLSAKLYLREEAVRALSSEERLALVKKEIEGLNAGLPAYKQIRQVRLCRGASDETAPQADDERAAELPETDLSETLPEEIPAQAESSAEVQAENGVKDGVKDDVKDDVIEGDTGNAEE